MALGFVVVALVATVVRWVLIAPQIATSWWRVSLPFARSMLPALGAGVAAIAVAYWARMLPGFVTLLLVGLVLVALFTSLSLNHVAPSVA